MTGILVGYALCSTAGQDLTARRDALRAIGVDAHRVYVDHGLTPKLTPTQAEHLLDIYATGERSVGEVAELFGICRATAYRTLD